MNRRRSEALAQLTAERDRLEREVETTRATTAARGPRRAGAGPRRGPAGAGTGAGHGPGDHGRGAPPGARAGPDPRGRILEQLGGTRAGLDESLAALEPLPEEEPAEPAPSADRHRAGRPSAAQADPGPTPPRAGSGPGREPDRARASRTPSPPRPVPAPGAGPSAPSGAGQRRATDAARGRADPAGVSGRCRPGPPPVPGRPARRVPVPAILDRPVLGRRPDHHVRHPAGMSWSQPGHR